MVLLLTHNARDVAGNEPRSRRSPACLLRSPLRLKLEPQDRGPGHHGVPRERGRSAEGRRGEKHEPASGAAGSVSDFPRLLSFSETFLPELPRCRAPRVFASTSPAPRTAREAPGPTVPPPAQAKAPRSLLGARNRSPCNADAGSTGNLGGRNAVKLPGDRTPGPKSGPRLQQCFHLSHGSPKVKALHQRKRK